MSTLRLSASLLVLACSLLGHVQAGQNCEARAPTVESLKKDLELAAHVAKQLESMTAKDGTQVVLIARVGQDLSDYGVRWTHLGMAYRDTEALSGQGAWRVVHKLNECGTNQSHVYRQGLAEFFSDDLYLREAGIVVLAPELQERLAKRLSANQTLLGVHETTYNMLAYPWEGRYQQSNQWIIETMATLLEPEITDRNAARRWLQEKGYQPQTIRVSTMKRLGARIGTAHIAFDDHPFDRRMSGLIDTVTVDSVYTWVQRQHLGGRVQVLQAPL